MSLDNWLAFCATETMLSFIPGPAVVFVVSVALARGTHPGIAAAVGILTANAGYFALSATGIAAIIVASHEVFIVLRWAGAAYLIWLGLGMVLTRSRKPTAITPLAVPRSFVSGVLVQGANPKALIFFLALLPQFIDPQSAVPFQVLVLAVSSIVIEFFVLAFYVAVAVRARAVAGNRFATPLTRVGGVFLIAAGARLALARSE
jgi:homoserine/homoserine lactone efflux protein